MGCKKKISSWGELEKHVKTCRDACCGCKTYLLNFSRWSARLPSLGVNGDKGEPTQSWLWHRIVDCKFHWFCILCGTRARENSCKLANLFRHQRTECHLKKVGQVSSDFACAHAPSADLFKEVYEAFFSGDAPSEGFILKSGIVGKDKVNRMLWALDEGHRSIKRRTLASCDALQLCRDESRSRLHIRYRAIDATWTVHSEYMGTCRQFEPSAIGLTKATEVVFEKFCTLFLDPPASTSLSPRFDKRLCEHIASITEGISVDSAESEVVASRDLCRADSFLPNCKWILRDAAHATRRVLQRGWKSDPVSK